MDWGGSERMRKEPALDEALSQDTQTSRSEAVNEATRLISDKRAGETTSGGGLAFSVPYVTAGVGKETKTMKEITDVTGTGSREVNDRIRQISHTLRSTRSFEIVEANQSEQATLATRFI